MAPDPTSFSNYDEVLVTHVGWCAALHFDTHTITAQATLTAKLILDGAKKLVLDTRGLKVESVSVDGADVEVAWEGKEDHEALGRGLAVPVPADKQTKDSVVEAVIKYSIDKSAAAVQWLAKEQTAGGEHPYLFTQCQAIHARSMLPCQDTPAVKATYSAEITVPAPLVAVMSALGNGDAPVEADGKRTYKFKQPVAICAYLIALAVGDLVSKEIGPRSKVWSEPKQLEATAYEFAETEDFIRAGEELLTPYVWGQYDVIVLPPSFPYGGMENPCLTFVTPTLLAGDRSLADVICHEIAHSWTGNLVTNGSWEHFWLNEGFTMYVQRSIIRRLIMEKGGDGDAFFDFDAENGRNHMKDDIERYGKDHDYTKLVVDLSGGIDPDDVFSSVPYEKGFSLLHYVQQKAGGHEPFNAMLKDYIAKYSYGHATSDDFKAMYMERFGDLPGVADIDWDTWLNGVGYPPEYAKLDTSILSGCTKVADAWTEGEGSTTDDLADFKTGQIVAFLDTMLNRQEAGESKVAIDGALLEKVDAAYKLTEKMNAEVRFRWQTLNIRAKRSEILEHVAKFLVEQGRMKFVRPLYRDLFAVAEFKELAQSTFVKNRDIYHPIAQKMLAADLQV